MNDSTHSPGLSPVEALRVIADVLGDPAFSGASEKLVVVELARRADNDTGRAWGSYDSLCRRLCCSRKTVRRALKTAIGRYIEIVAHGAHGAIQYRILRPGKPSKRPSSEGQNRHQETSAVCQKFPQETYRGHQETSEGRQETQTSFLTGDPSSAKKMRRKAAARDPSVSVFINWFCEEYQRALGREYIVQGAKDGKLVKDLMHAFDSNGGIDTMAELQRATTNMLADLWGRPNASIGILSSQINKWRSKANQKPRGRPSTFTPANTSQDYSRLAQKFD